METLQCMRLQDELDTEGTQEGAVSLDVSPFVGTWVNTNSASRGIVKICIAAHDDVLTMRAFGADDPEPHDWGEVTANVVYAHHSRARQGAVFTAKYDFDFMETHLGVILNQGLLVVAIYNTFKDDSGRAQYFNREFFYR